MAIALPFQQGASIEARVITLLKKVAVT